MNNSEIFDKTDYNLHDINNDDEYISIDYQNVSNFAEYVILTTFTIWAFIIYFSLMKTISAKMNKNIFNIDFPNEQIDFIKDKTDESKSTKKYILKSEFKKRMKKMKKKIKKFKKELKGYKQINIESDIIYMDDDMNSIHSNEEKN